MSGKESKTSIFSKVLEVGHAVLDAQFYKAKSSILNGDLDDTVFYSKSLSEDPTYAISSAGWKEKPNRITDGHLKQMSLKNSVVSAIIQTRQNQVSNYSKLVESDNERGWKLCIRDEDSLLDEIKEKLNAADSSAKKVNKEVNDPNANDEDNTGETSGTDDETEEYSWELERKAQAELRAKFKTAKKMAQNYVANCGLTANRPFETKKWNFDSALRAWVRDTLTFDRYASEIVPNKTGVPHHWFPVDAGTIKFASNRLKDYKDVAENFLNLDILYPERQIAAIEKQKVLDLKTDLLAIDAYKYVQVIRGKIERAYTADELKLGIRNVTTDIYNNGYGLSELELGVGLITGHLNAEFYNQAYFTQGFSAKGILHIKAAINRRKLETVRQQWQHMIRGSRNSFQTPIFAGMEDVEWIPLTQKHDDIGFEGWMRYLIKMLCAIFQIDPQEIGVGMKEEGSNGSLGGDNTAQKINQSKDKGLFPLLRHIENYINESILAPFDKRFVFKFTGLDGETKEQAIDRQEKEVGFKKTVNEIRAEDNLPPIPGMDDVILNSEFMSWYNQFSKRALDKQKHDSEQAGAGQDMYQDVIPAEDNNNEYGSDYESSSPQMEKSKKKLKKAKRIKVEYFTPE